MSRSEQPNFDDLTGMLARLKEAVDNLPVGKNIYGREIKHSDWLQMIERYTPEQLAEMTEGRYMEGLVERRLLRHVKRVYAYRQGNRLDFVTFLNILWEETSPTGKLGRQVTYEIHDIERGVRGEFDIPDMFKLGFTVLPDDVSSEMVMSNKKSPMYETVANGRVIYPIEPQK